MDKSNNEILTNLLNNLSLNIMTAGGGIKLALNNLTTRIQESSEASDRHAKGMYQLTFVIAGSAILNFLAIIWQTYH